MSFAPSGFAVGYLRARFAFVGSQLRPQSGGGHGDPAHESTTTETIATMTSTASVRRFIGTPLALLPH